MVKFNEEVHQYSNDKDEIYISVTTLIHKYCESFNKEYWSLYKALEILDSNFKKNKKIYLASKDESYLLSVISNNINIEDLKKTTQQILNSWEEKNTKSKIKGTNFHKNKESFALNSNTIFYEDIEHLSQDYKVLFNGKSLSELKNVNYFDCLPDGYYSELLLFHHEYKIAGTADVVIIKTDKNTGVRYVYIDDYKTNEVIKTENKYQNLKYPLSKYQDCNYNIYNLQTSLYGYLLECMGFNVVSTRITWINKNKEEIPFIFQYKKQDVINMLNHYKNSK